MAGITKRFGETVIANDDVSLVAQAGTIHAIVGENGAGKTTLMNVLYGRYRPDAGRIRVCGSDVEFRTPADAIRHGIGMVPQHSTLIPALTVLENLELGHERSAWGILRRGPALAGSSAVAQRLGVDLPWHSPARQLSIGALQKAEIVRALSRGASILILDEPTAALAPQEGEALFLLLRGLATEGRTAIVITHKLGEVLRHTDRVTVLRGGRSVAEVETSTTTAAELAALMVGPGRCLDLAASRPVVAEPASPEPHEETPLQMPVLEVRGVTAASDDGLASITEINLSVRSGEIVGVAGVDGSGQQLLAEAIVGLRRIRAGTIRLNGRDVTTAPVRRRLAGGLAYCPEDRGREGLIASFSVAENLLLGRQRLPDHGGGLVLNRPAIMHRAADAVSRFGVVPSFTQAPASALSGGNQQKLMVARALLGRPKALVALQPTRGLDIDATRAVYATIKAETRRGMGVLLFSLDLDEILEVADRVAVLFAGYISAVLSRADADRDVIGRLMTTGETG